MAEWGFWEWLTYGCIGIAALMLALDAAVKQSPDLNARFGQILATRIWAFTPFSLILLSALVIAIQHLGHSTPHITAGEPVASVTTPVADMAPAAPTHHTEAKPTKRIFVGFSPEYLRDMDKKNTAAESEAIMKLYAGKWIKVENERFSGATRSNPEIAAINQDPYVLISIKSKRDYIVMCKLTDDSQMETAMTTRPGSAISFVGMITANQNMLGAMLSLDPCELK